VSKKILIVDDLDHYLVFVSNIFKYMLGFDTVTAGSYEKAMDILKNSENKIDLALLDIRLDESDPSNIDGLRILEWINEHHPQIPVFMMSAYKEFGYAEKAINMGARHFFRKPPEVDELIKVIREKS
jgi:DNA-binding NtrC family response regulator